MAVDGHVGGANLAEAHSVAPAAAGEHEGIAAVFHLEGRGVKVGGGEQSPYPQFLPYVQMAVGARNAQKGDAPRRAAPERLYPDNPPHRPPEPLSEILLDKCLRNFLLPAKTVSVGGMKVVVFENHRQHSLAVGLR